MIWSNTFSCSQNINLFIFYQNVIVMSIILFASCWYVLSVDLCWRPGDTLRPIVHQTRAERAKMDSEVGSVWCWWLTDVTHRYRSARWQEDDSSNQLMIEAVRRLPAICLASVSFQYMSLMAELGEGPAPPPTNNNNMGGHSGGPALRQTMGQSQGRVFALPAPSPASLVSTAVESRFEECSWNSST